MRKAHDFIEKDLKRCYTVFRNLSGDSVQVDISIQNTVILFNSCEHKYFVNNSNNHQDDYYNRYSHDRNNFNAEKSVWILILTFFADSWRRLKVQALTWSMKGMVGPWEPMLTCLKNSSKNNVKVA